RTSRRSMESTTTRTGATGSSSGSRVGPGVSARGRIDQTRPATQRLVSIDAVRGLVMIIMALDHVRDFIHRGAMSYLPTDLSRTTPTLFLTRWITHFCAPMFMLTAGMGAYLWWHGKRSTKELSVFLVTRGLWLIVLELTIMRFGYNFDFSSRYPVLLLVLW